MTEKCLRYTQSFSALSSKESSGIKIVVGLTLEARVIAGQQKKTLNPETGNPGTSGAKTLPDYKHLSVSRNSRNPNPRSEKYAASILNFFCLLVSLKTETLLHRVDVDVYASDFASKLFEKKKTILDTRVSS